MIHTENTTLQLVDYEKKYSAAFRDLNVEWISKYFKMEDSDFKALDNPEGYIINKGGYIIVALLNEEPVGVCALIKMEAGSPYDYELAKMAVAPKAQGKKIGWLLGNAIIEKAKSLGASTLYLGSNTILQTAINLYRKLGFQKIADSVTTYEGCNIEMSLKLNV